MNRPPQFYQDQIVQLREKWYEARQAEHQARLAIERHKLGHKAAEDEANSALNRYLAALETYAAEVRTRPKKQVGKQGKRV